MKVYNDSDSLSEYIHFMQDRRDSLINELERLSNLFENLEWNDNIRERVCQVLNVNIEEMGRVIGTINNFISELDRLNATIGDYGNNPHISKIGDTL